MQDEIGLRILYGPNTVAAESAIIVTRAVTPATAMGPAPARPPPGLRPLLTAMQGSGLDTGQMTPGAATDWTALMAGLVGAVLRDRAITGLAFKRLERGRSFALVGADFARGRLCLQAALVFHDYWRAAGGIAESNVAKAWLRLKEMIDATLPGPQMRAIARACRELDIPVHRFSANPRYLQLGEGRHRLLLDLTDSSELSQFSMRLAADKVATHRILAANGIPVARQELLDPSVDAWTVACGIGLPVVVKPRGGSRSRGLTLGVDSKTGMEGALAAAREFDHDVIVESTIPGMDHRIYVAGDRVIGAVRSAKACVIGDGRRSIRDLVEDQNRRNKPIADLVSPIELGPVAADLLAGAGLSFDSVPVADQRIDLSARTGNYSGGMPVDVLQTIHPDNAAMLVRATQLIGLPITGIDFRIPDIAQSWRAVGGGICEINSRVGLKVLLAIDPDGAGKTIVMAVAGPSPRRMRHIVVVGGDADWAALDRHVEAIAARLQAIAGWRCGLSLSSGLEMDRYRAAGEALPLFHAYRRIIENPILDGAIYGCTADGVTRHGFGLERVDLAVFAGGRDQMPARERDLLVPFIAASGARIVDGGQSGELDAVLVGLVGSGD